MNDRRLYPSRALHGRVAHDIGRQIVSGAIEEGQYLPRETELSAQFAVSRQAVREALKVLAAKGLVHSRRRAGTQVLPRSAWNLLDPDVIAWHPSDSLPPDFFDDLIELRRLIEPAAAEFAARRGDPARIAVIAAALDDMRGSINDGDLFFSADAAFHRALFAASGNSLIDRLSTIVAPLLESSFRVQGKTHPSFEDTVTRHQAVLDAITNGDGETARRAMTNIVEMASDELVQAVQGKLEAAAD